MLRRVAFHPSSGPCSDRRLWGVWRSFELRWFLGYLGIPSFPSCHAMPTSSNFKTSVVSIVLSDMIVSTMFLAGCVVAVIVWDDQSSWNTPFIGDILEKGMMMTHDEATYKVNANGWKLCFCCSILFKAIFVLGLNKCLEEVKNVFQVYRVSLHCSFSTNLEAALFA